MGSFGRNCVNAFGSMLNVNLLILCSFRQNNQLELKIPAYSLQPQDSGSVIVLTDMSSNVYSSSNSTSSQLTIVNDFFVSSVNNSLQDSFVEVSGSQFGSAASAVTVTMMFSSSQVLSATSSVIVLSGSGSEFDVGDTVRFSGTGSITNLQLGSLYTVSSKPTPTSVTLLSMDRTAVTNLSTAADVSNVFMSVVSPCPIIPRTFTSTSFSCAHTPLSVQAQLVVGMALELSIFGITKTFNFPDFTLVPAPVRSLAKPTISLVSAAQRVASAQTVTLLGSNFGSNAAAVAVSVSLPSRCDRQFVATAAQERPLPSVGSPGGSATVTFKQLSPTSVSITVVATGLTSDLTGVHIHLLSRLSDATGPVVFGLCGSLPLSACPTGLSPTVSATWTAASGLTSAILDGLYSTSNIGLYANIHTASNPIFGELRANVDPALSSIVCTALSDAELPVSDVGNPSGSATVRFSNLNPHAAKLTMSNSAATAGQTATISFTTSTALAGLEAITLTFPAGGHVTAQAPNQCGISSPAGISTTSAMVDAGTHTITLTLAGSNTLAAGAVTVTCGGMTLGAKAAVPATGPGLRITTSKDTVAASVAIPAVGAVTAAAASALTLSPVAATVGQSATISFTTSTPLAASETIVLTFPAGGHVTAQAPNQCGISSPAGISTTSAMVNAGTHTITLTLAGSNTLAAGAVTVTCGGMTLGAKAAVPATGPGLRITTSKDTVAASVAIPAVGAVTAAAASALTLSPVAATVGQSATISFTTSTPLAASETIVLTFPAGGHVTAQAPNQCGISSPAGISTTSAMVDAGTHTITLTLAGSNTLAAGAVTVTCGGMTLGAKAAVPATGPGLRITTSKDTVAASVAIPAVGAVTAAAASALTLSPVAATVGQSATISFTTSTPLAASETIVLTFPAGGHVTAQAPNQCGISSPAGISTTSAMVNAGTHTITLTLAGSNTLAAGAVTVTCGGMTLGAKAAVPATGPGLRITTSKDTVAASVAIPAVGAVTAAAASALTLSPVAATVGQSATISFTTSTPLAASETIVLTFPAGGHVTAQAPNQCGISSPAGISTTSAMVDAGTHTITLTLAGSNTLAAGAVTVTCGGMTLGAKAAVPATGPGLRITTSKDTVAASVAIPAVGAVTAAAASALTLSPVAATVGQSATISFTTSTPLAASETIVLTFPAGGHVTAQAPNQCGISSPAGISTTSAMVNAGTHTITLTLAGSNTLAAGAVTVTCGGMTLGAKAAVPATGPGLRITTSKDTVAASVAIPAVGAVTAAAASALTLSPVAATVGQSATISFTTSTPLAASETIVLTFPAGGHVTAQAPNQCGISSPAGISTTSAMVNAGTHTITLTLAGSNTLAAGAVTVTCGGMTLGAKAAVPATGPGLRITTSKDTVAASVDVSAVGFVDTTNVVVSVSSTGLTSDLTGVHIHLLSRLSDATGPVVFGLCGSLSLSACPTGLSPTVSATWTAASGLTKAIYNSLFSTSNIGLYANIHTAFNPSGELRANINVRGSVPCSQTTVAAGSALQALTCSLQLGGVPHINSTALPILVSVAASDSISSSLPLVSFFNRSTGSSFSAPNSSFDTVPISPNASLCSESATNTLKLLAQSVSTIQRQSCTACGGGSCPAITGISTAHPGGGMVTVRGRNFGTVMNQVVLNVDVSNRGASSVSNLCSAVSQIDSVNFAAECPAPAGTGTNIQASVTIGGVLPLAAPSMFNYAMPPIIHSVSSVARDGGSVTVIGQNFGPNATESVIFSVINEQLTVTCKDPITVANISQMEVFVCSMPSSQSAQAVLNGLLDVVLSVNSLSIRVPALFSYIETANVTSISTGIRH
jgi:hypothetical protein